MPIEVMHWERRDDADRELMAKSALAMTQAMRASGAASARFYWAGPDTLVVQVDSEDAGSNVPPSADAARALFSLADQARQTRQEVWMSPQLGEQAYRTAGR